LVAVLAEVNDDYAGPDIRIAIGRGLAPVAPAADHASKIICGVCALGDGKTG